MSEPTGTVYALIDPRTGEVRYVGATVLLLEKRLANHLGESTNGNWRKSAWIAELKDLGLRPGIVAIEDEVPVSELETRERDAIKEYRSDGCKHRLFNVLPLVPGDTRDTLWNLEKISAEISAREYVVLERWGKANGHDIDTAVRYAIIQFADRNSVYLADATYTRAA